MTPQADAPKPTKPHRGTLLILLAGIFIAVLDFFIVNVAVPSIVRDLQASAADVQFILTGFAVAYASGLIIGGRLGDIFGRRRAYIIGVAVFTLSSTVCGIAPSAEVLIAGRVVQGLSAALLSPQVLSILGTTYEGEARARAFNAYGVSMGIAAVFGQVIGGLLIESNIFGLDWRSCFLINVPIGLVVLALTRRLVPESRAPQRPQLDLVGMVLIAVALTAVVLPLVEGREQGWPLWAWLCLGAAAVLLAMFYGYERWIKQRGGWPLIDLSLFRERAFTVGLFAQVAFYMGMAAFFLVFALYLQFGRGLDALDAGLVFVAIGAGYMATSSAARYVAARMGRQVIALGAALRLVAAVALIVIVSLIGVDGSIGWLIPALVLDGAGMGLAVAPLAATVMSRMTPQHAGVASGVLDTGIQVGNALGVAIIGVVFYGVLFQDSFQDSGALGAYGPAFVAGMAYVGAVAVVLVLLVQLLPRKTSDAEL